MIPLRRLARFGRDLETKLLHDSIAKARVSGLPIVKCEAGVAFLFSLILELVDGVSSIPVLNSLAFSMGSDIQVLVYGPVVPGPGVIGLGVLGSSIVFNLLFFLGHFN